MEPLKNAVLIAGPTASGKSALALKIAQETGGAIVNADSMQVYAVLRLLTARPDDADLAAAPHLLYGHVDPREDYSTGRWAREVEALRRDGAAGRRRLIFVGGTGLYFRALTDGLSAMPDVPPAIRRHWREALAELGPQALHRMLAERDREAAAAIRATDGQRIVRALEVEEASGKPISWWQGRRGTPIVDAASATRLVLVPDRQELASRIDMRFDQMVARGALDEARALAALGLDPAMPAMKAIGVRELLAADRGEIDPAVAVELAKTATRRYAKRQSTWFRTQVDSGWQRISAATQVILPS